jgi:hypothetical protein
MPWKRLTLKHLENLEHRAFRADLNSHTAYGIRHTAYSIQHTAYGIQHTAYGIRHTAYGIRHTAYGIRHRTRLQPHYRSAHRPICHMPICHMPICPYAHMPIYNMPICPKYVFLCLCHCLYICHLHTTMSYVIHPLPTTTPPPHYTYCTYCTYCSLKKRLY